MPAISVSRISDGAKGFAYIFSYAHSGQKIYESHVISTSEDAVAFLAHMAHKSWLDRQTYGGLATDICSRLELWK